MQTLFAHRHVSCSRMGYSLHMRNCVGKRFAKMPNVIKHKTSSSNLLSPPRHVAMVTKNRSVRVVASMHGHIRGAVDTIKPTLLTVQDALNRTYSNLLPGPARYLPTFLMPLSALLAAVGAAYGAVALQRLTLLLADLSTQVNRQPTGGKRLHLLLTVCRASHDHPGLAIPTRGTGSAGHSLPVWRHLFVCAHASPGHHSRPRGPRERAPCHHPRCVPCRAVGVCNLSLCVVVYNLRACRHTFPLPLGICWYAYPECG